MKVSPHRSYLRGGGRSKRRRALDAAIAPDVWRELVRRRLGTDTLLAVEAQGLGGLVVLVRGAGLDVGLERQDLGPPQLVLEILHPRGF